MDSISEIWFKFFAQIAQRKGDISLLRIFFFCQRLKPGFSGRNPKVTTDTKFNGWNPFFITVMKNIKMFHEINLYK